MTVTSLYSLPPRSINHALARARSYLAGVQYADDASDVIRDAHLAAIQIARAVLETHGIKTAPKRRSPQNVWQLMLVTGLFTNYVTVCQSTGQWRHFRNLDQRSPSDPLATRYVDHVRDFLDDATEWIGEHSLNVAGDSAVGSWKSQAS